MTQKNIKLIQVIGEVIIPLLGYFFWDWNFYFIALFYFLDILANTLILPFKVNKFEGYKNKLNPIYLNFFIYFILLIFIFFIGVFLTGEIDAKFSFIADTKKFILLKEMGIPQGIILIPLIVYASYMQYRMEFLIPKKQLQIPLEYLLKKHLVSLVFGFILLLFGYGIARMVKVPEFIPVFCLIFFTAYYSFKYKRV